MKDYTNILEIKKINQLQLLDLKKKKKIKNKIKKIKIMTKEMIEDLKFFLIWKMRKNY